jgi:hypothetical protein
MKMRRLDPRLILGLLFIIGGILSLLGALDIVSNAGGIFWGLISAAAGAAFLYILVSDRTNWWAAFPAFTFFGLAASSFLPDSLEAYDGLVFFLGISLGFWWVYFTNREHWWAIIPGGVLLTLGVVSVLDDLLGGDAGGGVFFLGLGLTFVLVAALPGGNARTWALIPGVILLVFGTLLGSSNFGLTEYLWPTVLILLGGYFIVRFFRNRPSE